MSQQDWPKELRGLVIGAAWIGGAILAIYVVALACDRAWFWFLRPAYQEWRCQPNVQADLNEVIWTSDPKVEKCTGAAERATCFVSTLEQGQRRTAPVTNWDCRSRRVPDGVREWTETSSAQGLKPDEADTSLRRRFSMSLSGFKERMEYVFVRLGERENVLNPGK